MRRLQPVIWSKGTFLTPQHLQLQDRYVENYLQFRLESLNYQPWGLSELRIDAEALAAGNFAISRATGVMPDGLAFSVPDSDAAPAAKALLPMFEADQDTASVYLAIPQYRERGLNVAIPTNSGEQGADTRYRAEVKPLRDENSGLAEKPIQVARKNFRLLVEGESREGSTDMQVARIKRTPTGAFQLDTHFVPPLLDIAANEYLMAILRRLVEILAAKSSILSGLRRQRSQSLADFTAADIANFWLLYTANSFFPVLRHLHETRRGHPEVLFHEFTALAGALTTFSLKIQPRDLPLYDHEDLGNCFTVLDEKLRELLETVVPSNFVTLPLKLAQPSIYATTIDEDKYLIGTRMYLAVNAEMTEPDIATKVPQLVKICSATQIEQLVRQALPGVQLTHMTSAPGAIPVKLNYQYFSLNQSGAAWDSIGRSRNFAAYVPGDIKNPNMELVILLPQAQ
ncbi:MAG: type VI secretion system baseplate subunit TssK [Candidatus Acidiferrales bacterium]